MRPDYRRLFLVLAAFLCFGAPSWAEGPGRYAVSPSPDGFVRLDTTTGAVSHCRQQNGVWRCEPLADCVPALTPAENAAPLTREAPNLLKQALARVLDLVRVLKHGRA